MPTDTMIVLAGVVGAFAFFTAVLLFVDATWKPSGEASRRH